MHYYDVLQPAKCTGKEFDLLLSFGWYPMGQTVFTTSHLFRDEDTPPMKVHWLRYPVSDIRDRTSHKRIRSKNKVFEVEVADPFAHNSELDSLYERYLDSVDFDGYSNIGKATYQGNSPNIYESKAIILRDKGKIISCGIFHVGFKAVASILHFFDPRYKQYSPGKYLILKTLDYCRDMKMEWYYPGYVIQGNSKMDYKLFLGKETAQYYHPEPHPLSGSWLPFRDELLSVSLDRPLS